jgi:uncharacterized membrane protein YsdA (DUF1294 family)
MTAATVESEPSVLAEPQRTRPDLSLAPSSEEPAPRDAAQARLADDRRVERVVLRKAIVGAMIGAVVCAPLYVGLVLLALRNSGTALGPPIGIAVGLGLYAGLFLGGSTGTLIGSKTLEHYERETLPAGPERAAGARVARTPEEHRG